MLLKFSPLQALQGSRICPYLTDGAWVLLIPWAPSLGWVIYALLTTRVLQAMMLFPLEKHCHSHFIMLIATHVPPPWNTSMISPFLTSSHKHRVGEFALHTCVSQHVCKLFTEQFSFTPRTPSFLIFTWHTVSSQWKILAFLWLIPSARPRDVISVMQGHASAVICRAWSKIQIPSPNPGLFTMSWATSNGH